MENIVNLDPTQLLETSSGIENFMINAISTPAIVAPVSPINAKSEKAKIELKSSGNALIESPNFVTIRDVLQALSVNVYTVNSKDVTKTDEGLTSDELKAVTKLVHGYVTTQNLDGALLATSRRSGGKVKAALLTVAGGQILTLEFASRGLKRGVCVARVVNPNSETLRTTEIVDMMLQTYDAQSGVSASQVATKLGAVIHKAHQKVSRAKAASENALQALMSSVKTLDIKPLT